MSRANGKPRGRPPYRHSKAALPKPGDEQCGDYSHARLVRMDNRFRARLLRAFKRGMHETIAEILATQLNRQSRSRKACRRS